MAIVQTSKIRLVDVANAANVSVATVSMALADHPSVNSQTKRRIQILGRKLGYRNSIEKTSRKSYREDALILERFGFLLLGGKLHDDARVGLLHSLTVSAAAYNIRMEVAAIETCNNSNEVEERTLAYGSKLDGLLISGLVTRNLLKKIESAIIPYVVLGHILSDPCDITDNGNEQIIGTDDTQLGNLATNFLFACGHKRIGFIAETLPKGLYYDKCLRGYKLAHLDAGYVPDPALIHITGKAFAGGAPGAKAMLELKDRPTGFVLPDARTAATFIQEMTQNGIRIGRNDIVVGGVPEMIKKYQLENFPSVLHDSDTLAQVAIRHLISICRQPLPTRTEINVPFQIRNISLPSNVPCSAE